MKKEWLVVDVTAVGSPDRAEAAILGGISAVFFANSGRAECAILGVILTWRFIGQYRLYL